MEPPPPFYFDTKKESRDCNKKDFFVGSTTNNLETLPAPRIMKNHIAIAVVLYMETNLALSYESREKGLRRFFGGKPNRMVLLEPCFGGEQDLYIFLLSFPVDLVFESNAVATYKYDGDSSPCLKKC
eukprot:GEMP01139454.1.p1 GENE.GEMP01139454.1~~GEMP01139454.1.p1  ORF type:complete len:127 (+),score=7.01 GEMP01139454.1:84-464(+)